MPLPKSLVAGKVPVAGGLAPAGAAPMAPAGGAAVVPGSHRLTFSMQLQTEDNWCWAATATSVSRFYDPASKWTQCEVANAILTLPTGTNCCTGGSGGAPAACDVPWFLDQALTATANLRDVRTGAFDFAALTPLITAGEPVCARVGWSGGGGHFVVLHGWEKTTAGDEFVDVADPFYGSSTILHADFVARYRSTGSWTHTYRTQP